MSSHRPARGLAALPSSTHVASASPVVQRGTSDGTPAPAVMCRGHWIEGRLVGLT